MNAKTSNTDTLVGALAVRAAEILRAPLSDRENLAIRIARMERRVAAVAELIEEAETLLAGVMGGEGDILALDADDIAPLKAALARCKGAQS